MVTLNDFTMVPIKSKNEKILMNIEERENYYKKLRNFYSQLSFNRKAVNRSERMITWINKFYSSWFYKRYKPIVIGEENLIKRNGVIFVCNHLCDKDMLLLLYGTYRNGKCWHPLVKKEVLEKKEGIIFKLGHSVFVDRNDKQSRHEATQKMAKLLINGYNVLIFPEGTYNRTEKPLKEFSGVSHVYLSQVLQCPIINCALTKNYDIEPVLMIDEPYIVPSGMDIEKAAEDSFIRLSLLVDRLNHLVPTRGGRAEHVSNEEEL